MPMPGLSDEKDVKQLLKKLLNSPDEEAKFAVVSRGPKDGDLVLSKKEKLKKKEVLAAAEQDAKEQNGGKPVRVEVMVGECRLFEPGGTTLRLVVYGKAIAKAVSCVEHLLVRGPYKTIGFTGIILEEVEDAEAEAKTTDEGAKSPPPTSNDAADGLSRFNQRFADFLPQVKAAGGTPIGDAARLKASEAGVFARKGEFPSAHALLDQAEALLRQAKSVDKTKSEGDAAAQFTARLQALKPQLDRAVASGTSQAQEIKLRVSELGVAARKKDFSEANRLLDQLETMLTPTGGQDGDFAKQWAEAKVTWRNFIELVDAKIEQVRGEMLSSGDPQLKIIADRGLPALTANHKTPVMKALFEMDSAPAETRRKAAVAAQTAIDAFRKHLTSDARIKALDENSQEAFGVDLTIRESIGKGLDALEQALRPIFAG